MLWDVAEATSRGPLEGHAAPVAVAAFSPDGGTLATASSGEAAVRLWDVPGGRAAGTLEPDTPAPGRDVACLAFSPDGATLYVGGASGLEARPLPREWSRPAPPPGD
ncbi:hypothetical protein HK102_012478 [Quaeritorhiza haematococci]|nr:hypothetical protein HK102_012478 [Quaeritorhiza haematococci]